MSGGCCDGSSPICLADGELVLGPSRPACSARSAAPPSTSIATSSRAGTHPTSGSTHRPAPRRGSRSTASRTHHFILRTLPARACVHRRGTPSDDRRRASRSACRASALRASAASRSCPTSSAASSSSGLRVIVEPGAGAGARIADSAFAAAGAELGDEAWQRRRRRQGRTADARGGDAPAARVAADRIPRNPGRRRERDAALSAQGVSAFALESVPRISRAQSMDALSSQATVAGYRGALLAAEHLHALRPDADDGRGNGATGARARDGRRRRRPAGTCGRTTPRSSHDRLRRPSGGRRRGRARSERGGSRSAASRRPATGGYARELDRRRARGAADGPRGRDRHVRRGDHDRGGSGSCGSDARDRRRRGADAARLRGRRPRGRQRRQLRALEAWRGARRARRDDRRAAACRRRASPSTHRSCTRATCRRCSS